MKLGDVLRKEREMAGVSGESMAQTLGMSRDDYEMLESGGNQAFESAARMMVNFAKALQKPGVNGLYYPCGIPFTEVDDYEYRVIRS